MSIFITVQIFYFSFKVMRLFLYVYCTSHTFAQFNLNNNCSYWIVEGKVKKLGNIFYNNNF